MFKKLIESFVRTIDCRTKCGDDGKDDIIPSTDFDSIDEITVVNRACGCKMGACHPRKYEVKEKNYDPTCFSLEYYFIEVNNETKVYCVDCKEEYIRRRMRQYWNRDPYPGEFKQQHVPFDNQYPHAKYYRWEDSIPEDLQPRVIFDECFRTRLAPLCFESYPMILLKCGYRYCRKPLYTFTHDCDECDTDDETLDMGFMEEDDDSALESDMEYFRSINNVTPCDKMIKTTFLNSHISDSELRMRVSEYEQNNKPLTPDNHRFDLRLEQDFLEYNGYF